MYQAGHVPHDYPRFVKSRWIEDELAISPRPPKRTAILSQQLQALTRRCILSDHLANPQTGAHINELCIMRIKLDQIPHNLRAQSS